MTDNWIFKNEISRIKVAYLLFLIFMNLMLLWFSINQPEFRSQSIWYFGLGTFGLIIWLIDFGIKNIGKEMISTAFWEDPVFGKWSPFTFAIFVAFAIGWSAFWFFATISTKVSVVATPQIFQVVELGIAGNILTTVAFAIMENVIFFYFIPPTIFGIFYLITRRASISLIGAVAISGFFVFPVYHFLAYGLTDIGATATVTLFGTVNSFFILVFRNPIFSDTWHAANNVAVNLARTTKVGLAVFGGG